MTYTALAFDEENRKKGETGQVHVVYRAECEHCGLVWPVKVVQGSEQVVWFRCPNCMRSKVEVEMGEELPEELHERWLRGLTNRSEVLRWTSPEEVAAWARLSAGYESRRGPLYDAEGGARPAADYRDVPEGRQLALPMLVAEAKGEVLG